MNESGKDLQNSQNSPRLSEFKCNKLENTLGLIANDINNLLLGISGNASLLRDSNWVKPEGLPLIEDILQCAQRSAELTAKMFNIYNEAENLSKHRRDQAPSGNVSQGLPLVTSHEMLQTLNTKKEKLTILVIDDEEVVRNVTSAILEHAGYKVISAVSGYEGLEIFSHFYRHIHCVLLDLSMPCLRGNLVYARIKACDPEAKVVLMSGHNDKQVMQEFANDSISGFLKKPFEPQSLIGLLENLIDQKKHELNDLKQAAKI